MRISDWSSDVCSSDLIAADKGVENSLRNLATILAGLHALDLDNADPAAVAQKVAPLAAPRAPWRHPAPEVQGLAALQAGETQRSEKRRGGKGEVSTCRTRWLPCH